MGIMSIPIPLKQKRMKRILALIIMLVCLTSVFGQINTTYYNDSIQGDSIINSFMEVIKSSAVPSKKIIIPYVDVSDLQREDMENDGKNMPFRFGKVIEQNLTLDDGIWVDLDSGRLWSLSFEADSAQSLNFIFKDFRLPDKGELYLVNHDNTIVYGPVTSQTIGNGSHFLTDVIHDSKVTILLYEPFLSRGLSSLTISKTVYGYRPAIISRNRGTYGSSEPCQVNVACASSYESATRADALVLAASGNYYFCGSLVLSTDLSFKPYFLTAFHCIDTNYNGSLSQTEIYNVQNAMFKFNYKTTTCWGNDIATTYQYNGSTIRAAYAQTDFALLEISQDLPQDGRHTWLGWDRTGNIPSGGICFHHPFGGVMKLAQRITPVDSYWNSDDYWVVEFQQGAIDYYSDGAVLLNLEKKVIGQLYGDLLNSDSSFCVNPRGFYGKFSSSWTGDGVHNDKMLSHWLDPNGTGINVMPSSTDLKILGQEYIYNNSCIYSISSLPTTMSAHWVLSGSNAANFVVENNTPSANMCRITRIDGAEFSGSANLTLSAQIIYGNTFMGTVSKQLTAPFIKGPMIPCGYSAYYVHPLPDNYIVEWEADGVNLENDLTPNGVQPGNPYSYVIIHNANESHYGTLEATVKYGNTVKGVFHKTIDSSGGFSGTWYQQAILNDTVNSTPKAFQNNSMLFYAPGRKVYLLSDHFIGATVTHTQTGVTLNNWSNNNGVISFIPVQSPSSSGSITVQGTAQSGCKNFKLRLFSLANPVNNSNQLSLSSVGNIYEFSICQEDGNEKGSLSDMTNSKEEWRLTIIKVDSANKVFDETVRGTTKAVNASGWSPGIYVALAQINDQYYSLKFSVGE